MNIPQTVLDDIQSGDGDLKRAYEHIIPLAIGHEDELDRYTTVYSDKIPPGALGEAKFQGGSVYYDRGEKFAEWIHDVTTWGFFEGVMIGMVKEFRRRGGKV